MQELGVEVVDGPIDVGMDGGEELEQYRAHGRVGGLLGLEVDQKLGTIVSGNSVTGSGHRIEVVLGNGGAVVGGIESFYTRPAANLKCWDGYQLPKTYATFELVFGVASLFVGDLVFVEDSVVEVSVFAACSASLLPVGVLPLPLPLP